MRFGLRYALIPTLFATMVLLGLVAIPSSIWAAQWTPVPEFEGRDRVVVQRGFDGPRYNGLRQCFQRHTSLVGARYYGALVSITDQEGSTSREADDAKSYARHAASQWAESQGLNSENDVVLVLGFRNRSIGVHVGTKWQEMGVSNELLREALQASEVSRHMGRQSFGDALCAALEIIDLRLALSSQESDRLREKAQELLPEAKGQWEALVDRVEQELSDEHVLRKKMSGFGEQAEGYLGSEARLEAAPQGVLKGIDSLGILRREVEAQLGIALARLEPLGRLEEDYAALLASIDDRPDSDWEGPEAARALLQGCEEDLTRLAVLEHPDYGRLRSCLREAERLLGAAEEKHFFMARAIPMGAALLGLLLLLLLLVALFLRRQRAAALLREEKARWEGVLLEVEASLREIQERFPWYFQGRERSWEGELKSVDEEITVGLHGGVLLKEAATHCLELIEKAKQQALGLRSAPLEKALRNLQRQEFTIPSGGRPSGALIPRAYPGELNVQANQIATQGWQGIRKAQDGLARVAPILEALSTQQNLIGQLLARGREEIQARREAGLPVQELQAQWQSYQERLENYKKLSQNSPVEGKEGLKVLANEVQTWSHGLSQGNRILDMVAQEVQPRLQRLRGEITRFQSRGVTLQEPGFEPAEWLDEVHQRIELLAELVASGQPEKAEESLGKIGEELQIRELRLEVCSEVLQALDRHLGALEEANGELKDGLFKLRMKVQRLDESEKTDELTALGERLEMLQKILLRLERQSRQIREAKEKGQLLRAGADTAYLLQMLEEGVEALEMLQAILGQEDEEELGWSLPTSWEASVLRRWGQMEDAETYRTFQLDAQGSTARRSVLSHR